MFIINFFVDIIFSFFDFMFTVFDLMNYVWCFLILVFPPTWITWRITCQFRRKCRWTSCPFRKHYFERTYLNPFRGYCKLYPPPKEEIEMYGLWECITGLLADLKDFLKKKFKKK